MAHEIWSKRFYSARNVPAWHHISLLDELCITDDGTRTAGDVLTLMGEPSVELVPLSYDYNGQQISSGYSAIVRAGTPEDPKAVQFGVVSGDYELITPYSAANMWDTEVTLPVETMAFLKSGASLFITGKLPTFDVRGEAVDNYLILNNPMDGYGAASGHVANIRVVCANTLRAAIGRSDSNFRIRHQKGATKLLARWLKDTYQAALTSLDVMKEAYDILAAKPVTTVQVKWIADTLYKMPQRPNPDSPRKRDLETVMAAYEYRRDWVTRARSTVVRLYEGEGTGLSGVATEGTAWAGWNAVAEFETYRRGTTQSMAQNIIDGDRARTIKRGYSLFAELAKN